MFIYFHTHERMLNENTQKYSFDKSKFKTEFGNLTYYYSYNLLGGGGLYLNFIIS